MRVLFVSGTTVGGSGRSQRELASLLKRRGFEVRFLVDDHSAAPLRRWAYEHLSDASVRWEGRRIGRAATALAALPGRRVVHTRLEGLSHATSPVPQNALPAALRGFRPAVVVASSLERWAWREVHARCGQAGIPTVLYVRETDSLRHLERGDLPDALVANAVSLAEALRAQGFVCTFVPSVVDVGVTRTASTRQRALAINPLPRLGGDVVFRLARAVPEVPFVVQESWPLKPDMLAAVEQQVAASGNAELRRAKPAGPWLYADARVLLVPHRIDNRPRVVLEAQANGIPVVAADMPGLAETVGAGGVLLPLDDEAAWAETLRRLWRDEDYYRRLCAAATEQSQRPDVDPEAIGDAFEAVLAGVVA